MLYHPVYYEKNRVVKSVFCVNNDLMSASSEYPDITKKNNTRFYQKGQKSEFFREKITSGNSEVAFLEELRR